MINNINTIKRASTSVYATDPENYTCLPSILFKQWHVENALIIAKYAGFLS